MSRPVEVIDDHAGEWAALRVAGVGFLVFLLVYELASAVIMLVGGQG